MTIILIFLIAGVLSLATILWMCWFSEDEDTRWH